MTLGELFNAPTEFTLETDGVTERFFVAKPSLLQEGEFQRWLEQLAFEAIDRRTYQSDEARAVSVRMHDQDCAVGAYEWGGALALRRFQTRRGFVKFLTIICRDQGLTDEKAERLVEKDAAGLLQVFKDKVTDDPKALGAVLSTLEPPAAFLLRVLLTHPLIMPSSRSPGSPPAS